MANQNNIKSTAEEHAKLLYGDRVLPETADAMSKRYGIDDKTGYRFMNMPMKAENHLPLGVKKEQNPTSEPKISLGDQRQKWTTEKRQLQAISEHAALSNFDTPEAAAKTVGDMIEAARIFGGDTEAEKVAEIKGPYICQFDYKKTSGLVEESNKKMHFNFLPFEGWKPEDDFNEEFGYRHYTEFYNPKQKDNE